MFCNMKIAKNELFICRDENKVVPLQRNCEKIRSVRTKINQFLLIN